MIVYRLDMKDLWKGEVNLKRHSLQEQEDDDLDKHFAKIINSNDIEDTFVSNVLKINIFLVLVHSNMSQNKISLQSTRKHPEQTPDASSSPEYYRQRSEMTSIVGTYQHESNENLDEYFKAVGMLKAIKNKCDVPYDANKNKYGL